MGYFTTAVAAAATNASNLRPAQELPNISLFDAFLPRCVDRLVNASIRKAKDGHLLAVPRAAGGSLLAYLDLPGQCHDTNIDPKGVYSVRRDKYGNKQIVVRRSRAETKGHEQGKQEKNNGHTEQKEENKPAGSFSAEEDVLLKELKVKQVSFKDIASEMKRSQKQVRTRCQELNITDTEAAKDEGKNNGKGGSTAGGKKQKTFTTEDDNKLKAMAANGSPWSDIARELKYGIDQLKSRLQEIDPDAAREAEKEDEHTQKQSGGRKKKEAKHQQHKAPSSTGSSEKSEIRFTMQEWITLQEDGIFGMHELQLLMDILMADKQQPWLGVASRFFDRTGRHVHPDDIREKFEQIARMGRT